MTPAGTMSTIADRLLFVSVLLLLATGCGGGAQLDASPEIRYGQDECDQCRMIINEPRFAAAYVTADGQTRRFDDVGGMLIYDEAHDEEVAIFWIHDYDTGEWVKASDAYFVWADAEALHTPMGYGIVAFADRARAEALAAETQGTVLTFSELRAQFEPAEMDMGMQHQHE